MLYRAEECCRTCIEAYTWPLDIYVVLLVRSQERIGHNQLWAIEKRRAANFHRRRRRGCQSLKRTCFEEPGYALVSWCYRSRISKGELLAYGDAVLSYFRELVSRIPNAFGDILLFLDYANSLAKSLQSGYRRHPGARFTRTNSASIVLQLYSTMERFRPWTSRIPGEYDNMPCGILPRSQQNE